MNAASDLTLFWGIDGGVEMIKLLHQYGVDLSRRTPKDWTPLSYAKAKGKYGATEEKGIYPEVTFRALFFCLLWPQHDPFPLCCLNCDSRFRSSISVLLLQICLRR